MSTPNQHAVTIRPTTNSATVSNATYTVALPSENFAGVGIQQFPYIVVSSSDPRQVIITVSSGWNVSKWRYYYRWFSSPSGAPPRSGIQEFEMIEEVSTDNRKTVPVLLDGFYSASPEPYVKYSYLYEVQIELDRTYRLATLATGSGFIYKTGTTISPAGDYGYNERIDITAAPATGWQFVEWKRGEGTEVVDPSSASTSIIMSRPKTAWAIFSQISDPDPVPPPYQEYTLRTYVVNNVGGTLKQGSETPSGEIVEKKYAAGIVVPLKADAESDSWVVGEWSSDADQSPYPGQTTNTVTMNRDKIVTVTFARPNINLRFDIIDDTSAGNLPDDIRLGIQNRIANIYQKRNLPYTAVLNTSPYQFFVDLLGYTDFEVKQWDVTNSSGTTSTSTSSLTFSTNVFEDTTIAVHVGDISVGATYSLTTSIIGNGSVAPSSGVFEAGSVVTLTANPADGSTIYRWIGADTDPTLTVFNAGFSLSVLMNQDRHIEVEFQEIPIEEAVEPLTTFYCPSDEIKSNIVSFNYTNNTGSLQNLHFKASFYNDIERNSLVFMAFSLNDIKRWYRGNNLTQILSPQGVSIPDGDTITIVYDPEILPLNLTNEQKWQLINNGVGEKHLICGQKYYIDIEIYNTDTSLFEIVDTITLLVSCDDVDGHYWGYNQDAKNWMSSGQGYNDLVLAYKNGQMLNPHISSSLFNHFAVAWDNKSENITEGGFWDSDRDELFFSGQGWTDKFYIKQGINPKVITDQSQNFYISNHSQQKLSVFKCAMPIAFIAMGEQSPEGMPEKILCYPGTDELVDASFKMRVYEPDTTGSMVVENDKPISVVEKRNVRLEIEGIPGAYAVRFRNPGDLTWNEWIKIETDLYSLPESTEFPEDMNRTAYFIDNERFICPWMVSGINGIRRVCCQILTNYGVTNTHCIDIFVNLDQLQYSLEFYRDEEHAHMVSNYKGYPIASLPDPNFELEGENNEILPPLETDTIYFKVIFSEKPEIKAGEIIYFNVIQQGMADIYDQPLTPDPENDKIYYGSFNIAKEDGIFNKDGLAFINVILPGEQILDNEICNSDMSDKFNLIVTNRQYARDYIGSDPVEVYKQYRASHAGKFLNVKEFQQSYDIDDNNFRFGNPDFFREK